MRIKYLNSISGQITFAFCSLILIIIILEVVAYSRVKQLPVLNSVSQNFAQLQKDELYLKSLANEFIAGEKSNIIFFQSGESKILQRYDRSLSDLFAKIKSIQTQLKDLGIQESGEDVVLIRNLKAFDAIFQDMVEKIKERGFGKHGLVGEFDGAMMDLMSHDFGTDNIAVLNLQLYVKTYLLYGDKGASKDISNEIYNFSTVIDKYIKNDQVDAVITSLSQYEKTFKKLVLIDEQLGTYTKQGLGAYLTSAMKNLDDAMRLTRTQTLLEETYSSIQLQVALSFGLVTLLSMFAAGAVAWRLSITVVNPILEIKKTIEILGRGEIPKKYHKFKLTDINDMAAAVNDLVSGLKDRLEFANSIGRGDFTASLKVMSESDSLGKGLLDMRNNLQKLDEESKQRAWVTQGIATFAEVLRAHNDDLAVLGKKITQSIARYLNVQAVGLYLINDESDEHFLELTAGYAFELDKMKNNRIELGDGLVGQAVKDIKMLYLTELPPHYFKISSGLGNSCPRFLLIVPIKQNGIGYGALEIASFRPIPDHERIFIERLSESVASTFSTAKFNNKNQGLLKESVVQAQVMKTREEELRQQIDQLRAEQEQIKRRYVEVQQNGY